MSSISSNCWYIDRADANGGIHRYHIRLYHDLARSRWMWSLVTCTWDYATERLIGNGVAKTKKSSIAAAIEAMPAMAAVDDIASLMSAWPEAYQPQKRVP